MRPIQTPQNGSQNPFGPTVRLQAAKICVALHSPPIKGTAKTLSTAPVAFEKFSPGISRLGSPSAGYIGLSSVPQDKSTVAELRRQSSCAGQTVRQLKLRGDVDSEEESAPAQ